MRRSMWVSVGAALMLLATVGGAAASANEPNPKSEAEITVVFSTDCTGFMAGSSKDISFVEIHFADGTVVKDESTRSPEHSYAGTNVVASATVKSGTTTQTFTCVAEEPGHGQD